MNRKPGQLPQRRGGSYEVGYRKPPVQTRFQPGSSGNPKGRPKRLKSDGAILTRILDSCVLVNEAGQTKQITRREALYKTLVAKAMQGDPRQQRLLLKTMQELGVALIEEPSRNVLEVVFIKASQRRDD